MKLSSRSALALLLGTVLATSLSSCDYRWSPGENTQFKTGFTNAPHWRNSDVNRDSINNQQRVEPASGEGSAKAIKTGTVKEQMNSAPAGKSATSPQDASGQMAPAQPNSSTDSKTPAVGNSGGKGG